MVEDKKRRPIGINTKQISSGEKIPSERDNAPCNNQQLFVDAREDKRSNNETNKRDMQMRKSVKIHCDGCPSR